jgi:hypothetical protein
VFVVEKYCSLAHNPKRVGTYMMDIGHGLVLTFEQSPSDEELVAEAITRHTVKVFKQTVLLFNKSGLLSRLRFDGRRKMVDN